MYCACQLDITQILMHAGMKCDLSAHAAETNRYESYRISRIHVLCLCVLQCNGEVKEHFGRLPDTRSEENLCVICMDIYWLPFQIVF